MIELGQLPVDPIDQLNAVLNESEVNKQLMDQHTWLKSHFGESLKPIDEKIFPTEKGKAHEYILQVGELLTARDVFTERSLEVGGKASDYKKLRTVRGLFRPGIVTDIEQAEGVDVYADARNLQFESGSMDAILAIALPGLTRSGEEATLHSEFLNEAYRVLAQRGRLIMSGASAADLDEALALGFSIEAGNGCIVSRLSTNEVLTPQGQLFTPPRLDVEFLLHK
ncbi:MAG: class I SAM-dependent methyltransferase [bacterium]|nr:class I SAM-dependent methyltransferase [bacterium]